MKRENNQIILNLEEAKDIIKNVTKTWEALPNKEIFCCGFYNTFNQFKKIVEEG